METVIPILMLVGLPVLAIIIAILPRILKDGSVKRLILALPELINYVTTLVRRADVLIDEINEEYGERAVIEGRDARLLWVIDQTEKFAKERFGVNVDIDWLINVVEDYLDNNHLYDGTQTVTIEEVVETTLDNKTE